MDGKVLITGVAGFIGSSVAAELLRLGQDVVGVDNLNDYYDVGLKHARLERLDPRNGFTFHEVDITNERAMAWVFKTNRITRVLNLAAQAGVRYSLTNPRAYQKTNIEGFLNLLELAREYEVENFVFASSSSVYGKNKEVPYTETDRVDNPISLYAATKKSNELMAHAYSHLFGIPCTGLRYFTVYGPWGRPDMALFLFTQAIMENRPINVYNYGNMQRDFTYISDIVAGTLAALEKPVPYAIYNLGNSNPTPLMEYIQTLEQELGTVAEKKMLPLQDGDVISTSANIEYARQGLGYNPKVTVSEGIPLFVKWFKWFYGY